MKTSDKNLRRFCVTYITANCLAGKIVHVLAENKGDAKTKARKLVDESGVKILNVFLVD